MTDTEKQYDWTQTGGFHARLIPAIIIGALICTPLFFLLCLSFRMGPTAAMVVSLVLGLPVGSFLGYLVGLGLGKKRLQWVKWAEDNGWEYTAKPKSSHALGLQHMDQLKHSNLYWAHAHKSNLLTRTRDGRCSCIHTATSFSHLDLKHDSQNSNKAKSSISIYLLVETENECPEMTIHARTLTDRIKLPGKLQTVRFESTDFNQKWTVKARDPKAAYDRLNQETLEFMMSQDDELLVEFTSGLMIIQRRLLDSQSMFFAANPRSFYERHFRFAEAFTRSVPDDLLKPVTLSDKDSSH